MTRQSVKLHANTFTGVFYKRKPEVWFACFLEHAAIDGMGLIWNGQATGLGRLSSDRCLWIRFLSRET